MQAIVLIICILVAIGGIVGIVFGVRYLSQRDVKKESDNTDNLAEREKMWADLKQRYEDSMTMISSYSTNLEKALNYPAMNDTSESLTAQMHSREQDVQDVIHTYDFGTPPLNVLEDFSITVESFENAVRFAIDNAKELGTRRFGYVTEKEVKKARRLLQRLDVNSPFGRSRDQKMQQLGVLVESINARYHKEVIPIEALNSTQHVPA